MVVPVGRPHTAGSTRWPRLTGAPRCAAGAAGAENSPGDELRVAGVNFSEGNPRFIMKLLRHVNLYLNLTSRRTES